MEINSYPTGLLHQLTEGTGTMGRIRWSEHEWNAVVANALPHMDLGVPRLLAMQKAQRAVILDKARHKAPSAIGKSSTPSGGMFDAARERVSAMSPADRAALLVGAQANLEAESTAAPGARWTARERALMASAVQLLRSERAMQGMSLAELYIRAQRMTLPADRQRSESGIKQGSYAGLLARQHAEGLQSAWQYPETKDPLRGRPAAPPAEPRQTAAAAYGVSPAPVSESTRMAGDFVTATLSALERLLVARDAQMAEQMSKRQAASTDGLLAALPERIGPMVQELLQVQIGHIAAAVTDGFRRVLLEELGGPGSAPAPAPAPASVDVAPTNGSAPASRGLRVDVLGTMDPEWVQRIRDATDEGDDLRFYPFDAAAEFAPHRGRTLLLMQQGKLPRVLQKKLEATGVQPVLVRDAGGHVLRAVQELKNRATLLQ